jgi:hypothetical protein
MGIPCRHFARVLQILPHHVHVRWHRAYIALFGRAGSESETCQFLKRAKDVRLLISKDEYKQLLGNVAAEVADPAIFDVPDSFCFQKTPNGMIPFDLKTGNDGNQLHSQSAYSGGTMEEEHGYSSDESDGEGAFEPPVLTGCVVADMTSQLHRILNITEPCDELYTETQYKSVRLWARQEVKMRERYAKSNDYNGEFVSPYSSVDQRRKGKRKKARSEPKRRRVTQNSTTALTQSGSLF